MYIGECVCDIAIGICIFGYFVSMLEIAMITDFIVSGPLGPPGFFLIQGGITFLGAIFMKCCVKETQGLTDLEKKQLYTPLSLTKVLD